MGFNTFNAVLDANKAKKKSISKLLYWGSTLPPPSPYGLCQKGSHFLLDDFPKP